MPHIDPRLREPDERPLVAIDIDGVLNVEVFVRDPDRFRHARINRYFMSVEHALFDTLQPLLDADAAGAIRLVWGTMWEELAITQFSPTMLDGLGVDWPVIYFLDNGPASLNERRQLQELWSYADTARVYFKSLPMAQFAEHTGQRVVWLDDGVTNQDRLYFERHGLPVVPIHVNPTTGLQPHHVDAALRAALEIQ